MRQIQLLTNLTSRVNWHGNLCLYALGLGLGLCLLTLRDGGQAEQ